MQHFHSVLALFIQGLRKLVSFFFLSNILRCRHHLSLHCVDDGLNGELWIDKDLERSVRGIIDVIYRHSLAEIRKSTKTFKDSCH
jgi:hypothetical protein